jgi:hypothetical protein
MKKLSAYDSEQIVREIVKRDKGINPLKERRDYGEKGHDQVELQALTLENKGMLPEDMKKQLGIRLEDFPDRKYDR